MILIDQSVGSRDLIKYPPLDNPSLACLTSLSMSEDTKSSADICFIGNGPSGKLSIGIEFKSLSDLLSSSESGRLQATQIPAMLEAYSVCWILYYGSYRCSESGVLEIPYKSPAGKTLWKPYTFHSSNKRSLPYSYLESLLMTLNVIGVSSKHCYSISECAQWIACLHHWWTKPWNKHQSMRTFDKSSDLTSPSLMPGLDSHTQQMIATARSLPGLGFERALEAATYFDSIYSMNNADLSQWESVPRIGKVIAKSVYNAIRETRSKKKSSSTNVNDSKQSKSGLDIFTD